MEVENAKKIAAKLLSYKMYTCKEVLQKLIQKGISEEVAEDTVGQFCNAGILNDEEYAKAYMHDGVYVHLKGVHRLKQELAQKGVAQSIIEKAVMSVEDDAETQLAEYVKIRFGDRDFSDWKEIEKAKAHLVRRGFGFSEIKKCSQPRLFEYITSPLSPSIIPGTPMPIPTMSEWFIFAFLRRDPTRDAIFSATPSLPFSLSVGTLSFTTISPLSFTIPPLIKVPPRSIPT